MAERIRELLLTALVLSNLLLLSCSSSVNQGGAQDAPVPPIHVQLAMVAQGLQVAWEPVSGATHYTLFWGSEPGEYKSLVNCESPAVILSRLNREQLYFIAVTAWNQRGESNFSNELVLVYDDGSGRPETYLARGNDLMNRGHYAGAQAYFSAAIRLDPGNLYAYQSRAILRQKINQPDLAREDETMAEMLFKKKRISLRQAGW
ncbi:MAG: tetratricopeptide repeat protein [Desulfomonilaceae bacterium]